MSDLVYEQSILAVINRRLGTQFRTQEELRRYLRDNMREFNETDLRGYCEIEDK